MILFVGRKDSVKKNLVCDICKEAEYDHVFTFSCETLSFVACESCCVGLEKALKSRAWAIGIYQDEDNS